MENIEKSEFEMLEEAHEMVKSDGIGYVEVGSGTSGSGVEIHEKKVEFGGSELVMVKLIREMGRELSLNFIKKFDEHKNEISEQLANKIDEIKRENSENYERLCQNFDERVSKLETDMNGMNDMVKIELKYISQEWDSRHKNLNEKISKNIESVENFQSVVASMSENCVQMNERVSICEGKVERIDVCQKEIEKKFGKLDIQCQSQMRNEMADLKQQILCDVNQRVAKGTNVKCCGKEVSFENECKNKDLIFENYRVHDPNRFIQQLRRIKDEIDVAWEKMEFGLTKILIGEAGCWYTINQRHIKSYEEFEIMFRNQFCNDTYRNYLLDLLTGNYAKFSLISPCEYLTNLANRLLGLEMFNETALCQRFSKHFGNKIYFLCTTKGVNKLSDLFEILNLFEKSDIISDMRAQPNIGLENIRLGSYVKSNFVKDSYEQNNRHPNKNNIHGSDYRNSNSTTDDRVHQQKRNDGPACNPNEGGNHKREGTVNMYGNENKVWDKSNNPGEDGNESRVFKGSRNFYSKPYDRERQVNVVREQPSNEKYEQLDKVGTKINEENKRKFYTNS